MGLITATLYFYEKDLCFIHVDYLLFQLPY